MGEKITSTRRIELLVALDAVRRELEIVALGGGCDLVDEKDFAGVSTTQGNLCRIGARAQYLLDALACEMGGSEDCCDKAAAEYCTAFELCKD